MPKGVVRTDGVSLPTGQGFFHALEQWWLRERAPRCRARRRRSRAAGRSSFPTRWRSEIEPRQADPAALDAAV